MSGSFAALSGKTIQAKNCFVCGRENLRGLNVPFYYDGKIINARFTSDKNLCGFDNIVHGGILVALADKAMMHLVWASGLQPVTAEITVKFHGYAKAGDEIGLEASFDKLSPKLIKATCRIKGLAGTKIAAARGKFLPFSQGEGSVFRKTF